MGKMGNWEDPYPDLPSNPQVPHHMVPVYRNMVLIAYYSVHNSNHGIRESEFRKSDIG